MNKAAATDRTVMVTTRARATTARTDKERVIGLKDRLDKEDRTDTD